MSIDVSKIFEPKTTTGNTYRICQDNGEGVNPRYVGLVSVHTRGGKVWRACEWTSSGRVLSNGVLGHGLSPIKQKKRRYKTLEELVAMGSVRLSTTDSGVPLYHLTPYGVTMIMTHLHLSKGLVGTITTDTNPYLTVEMEGN
jgi:hypothetical protein